MARSSCNTPYVSKLGDEPFFLRMKPPILCFDKGINWSGERRPRTQRLFFGKVKQELNRDLWARVLDVAYKVEHSSNSIISRDHGLLKLIFLLPDIIEKIKSVKKEVQEKISKNISTFENSPNKPIEDNSSIYGLRKTTLAYRVYNDKSIVGNFDIRAWCIVNQEHNEKKLLQKIFNQVIGLKERFNENDIDDDVVDKKIFNQVIGLKERFNEDNIEDDVADKKERRFVLTNRKKEMAFHGKRHSDPPDLRLLRPEESWELLEKTVFGEKRCPDELKYVRDKIVVKCNGLSFVLDLIGGIISRKEKKEALWPEVLNNLSSFII
ncbi:hypothetical protein T459_14956 [Capsicum annuum]|uniref:NB-ARC domain-containing protein n=1 Tax=Capsicum annuum TaxID=4072 RepID=A0A2G2ZJ39_CAPAN|nr:hypothetical protein T459_14956 [Capsicum annuum]